MTSRSRTRSPRPPRSPRRGRRWRSTGAAWIVGGAIRDALLGEPVADADLAVEPGREEQAARAVARVAGGSAFPLSEEHASLARRRLDRGLARGRGRLRADWIEGDLRARDFTVNAVADPAGGRGPIDPTGGVADARGPDAAAASDAAFADDPSGCCAPAGSRAGLGLRSTRGPRAGPAQRRTRPTPPGERQFAELRGIVAGRDPLRGIELMDELALTAVVLPELEALRGVVQNPNHHLDVLGHTLAVLEEWLGIEADLARSRATWRGR